MNWPAVRAAPALAKAEQAIYRAVLRDTGPIIGKEQQAADCLAAIANCSDLTELAKLHYTYAETQGPAAEAARVKRERIHALPDWSAPAPLNSQP